MALFRIRLLLKLMQSLFLLWYMSDYKSQLLVIGGSFLLHKVFSSHLFPFDIMQMTCVIIMKVEWLAALVALSTFLHTGHQRGILVRWDQSGFQMAILWWCIGLVHRFLNYFCLCNKLTVQFWWFLSHLIDRFHCK